MNYKANGVEWILMFNTKVKKQIHLWCDFCSVYYHLPHSYCSNETDGKVHESLKKIYVPTTMIDSKKYLIIVIHFWWLMQVIKLYTANSSPLFQPFQYSAFTIIITKMRDKCILHVELNQLNMYKWLKFVN